MTRSSGSWGGFTRRAQTVMLVLVILLAGAESAAGAARKGRSRQLQEGDQPATPQGDDSECLKGLVDLDRQQGDEDQSSALVTWTATALRSPCNYTKTLKGITCSNRRIVSISLPSSDLVGTIPDSLSSCYFLQSLDLSSNVFSGLLPTALGALSFLSVLSLANNNLSGAIPYELATLSSLTSLDLRQNQLSGLIPPQLGLISLHFFNVSNNKLSGRIPATLSNTSTGAPRFDSSCFAGNPNLYGFPLNPNPGSLPSSPPFSNKKSLSARTIVGIILSSGLLSLTFSCYMVWFWLLWRDRHEPRERDNSERIRDTQKMDSSDGFHDGWKEVLARL